MNNLGALFLLFSCCFAVYCAAQQAPTVYTCVYDNSANKYKVMEGNHSVPGAAIGWFNNSLQTDGYPVLYVSTVGGAEDYIQVRAAGYLEAYLTSPIIYDSYRNLIYSTFIGSQGKQLLEWIEEFTLKTMAWTYGQVEKYNRDSIYWYQVGLVLEQFEGILDGYNENSNTKLRSLDIFLMNMVGDLDDLIPAMMWQHNQTGDPMKLSEEEVTQAMRNTHCSVLIKPVANNSELFNAHDMWATFSQMINVYKYYSFSLSTEMGTTSNQVSFSSYPGFLSSEDDFYIMSSGLVVMETTNEIFNMSLYDAVVPSTLMSWIRAIISNRMASNGSEWVSIMGQHNSGTYNNQWMVIDYNLFVPGQPLAPNTLWIAEQIPGYFPSADVTEVINTQGYWASYNVPYFPFVYEISGYTEAEAKYGPVLSYSDCPRANIFRQRQGAVQDLSTYQSMMRYNEFQTDPLSLGCPVFAISARADLITPGAANVTLCGQAGTFGAINSKITSSTMVPSLSASIISGPTHDTQPVFSWSNQIDQEFPNSYHYGQPTSFDFQWKSVSPPQ